METLTFFGISFITGIMWMTSFLLILYTVYYFLIGLFAFKRCPEPETAQPKNRFAVLIPARNEAAVIGQLVDSLKMQNYPPDLYEVFVIPNNCTDDTEAEARRAGATILECVGAVASKGQVLSSAFDYFEKRQYAFDAYCIFDADNLIDPRFLREMNRLLCSGVQAAQGKRESKNPQDTVISSCYSIYYHNLNRFYNHARSAIGLSAVVNGTGFMVSADAIRKLGGWHTQTITEDLEFSALCALNRIRIHWAPNAVVYDEQPLTFSQSWRQRKRWSSGMQHCLSIYWRPLLSAFVKKGNRNCADVLLMFLATHIQVAGFLSCILTLSLSALHVDYSLFPQTDIAFRFLASFDVSYLSAAGVAMAALILERKNPLKMLKGILFTWFFLASWLPINFICLFKKTTEWHAIVHVKDISLEDVLAA